MSESSKSAANVDRSPHTVPVHVNSPTGMIESIVSSKHYAQHDIENQVVDIDGALFEGWIRYATIEPGLWVIASEVHYLESVSFQRIIEPERRSDYYILSLEVLNSSSSQRPALMDGQAYKNAAWIVAHPQKTTDRSHFKGSKERTFAVIFTKAWFDSYTRQQCEISHRLYEQFISSKSAFFYWPDDQETCDRLFEEVAQRLHLRTFDAPLNGATLKESIDHLFQHFSGMMDLLFEDFHPFNVPDTVRTNVLLAAKVMLEHIQQDFMGIDQLAQMVGLSPSKLKSEFKRVFGTTIFQFYRNKQLEQASQLIKDGMPIKEVADQFGYQDPYKFSLAFKKRYGMLPSMYRN